MSFLLKFLLSLLLIPMFLVFLFFFLPVMLLISCVTSTWARRVHIQTFTTSWTSEEDAEDETELSRENNDNAYDVDCTVIRSTIVEEEKGELNEGK